jgi:hypothetical protein
LATSNQFSVLGGLQIATNRNSVKKQEARGDIRNKTDHFGGGFVTAPNHLPRFIDDEFGAVDSRQSIMPGRVGLVQVQRPP